MKRSLSSSIDENNVPIEKLLSPSMNFPEFQSVAHDHPKKAAKIPKPSAPEFKYDVDGLPNKAVLEVPNRLEPEKAVYHVITMPLMEPDLRSDGSSPNIAVEVDLNFADPQLQSDCDSSSQNDAVKISKPEQYYSYADSEQNKAVLNPLAALFTVIDSSALQSDAHSPPNKAAKVLKTSGAETESQKRIRLFGVEIEES